MTLRDGELTHGGGRANASTRTFEGPGLPMTARPARPLPASREALLRRTPDAPSNQAPVGLSKTPEGPQPRRADPPERAMF